MLANPSGDVKICTLTNIYYTKKEYDGQNLSVKETKLHLEILREVNVVIWM